MGDQGASLVEDRCGAMWSWALGVDEGAEAIELKIGREHAGHFALQGRSHSNYWCAKIEGKIRLGDKGPARFHGLATSAASEHRSRISKNQFRRYRCPADLGTPGASAARLPPWAVRD